MKNLKDPKFEKDPRAGIPAPETMEEFREMSQHAMALAAKTAVSLSRMEKMLKRVIRLAGDSSRNTVRVLERDILALVEEEGRLGWMRVRRAYHDIRASEPRQDEKLRPAVNEDGEDLRDIGRCPLLLLNPREALVIDVRRVLRPEETRAFAREHADFPRRFPELAADREVYGAIAYQLEEPDQNARAEAWAAVRENGLMLIRCAGKHGMKIQPESREGLRVVRKE